MIPKWNNFGAWPYAGCEMKKVLRDFFAEKWKNYFALLTLNKTWNWEGQKKEVKVYILNGAKLENIKTNLWNEEGLKMNIAVH